MKKLQSTTCALAVLGMAATAPLANAAAASDVNLYGYLSWRVEKVWDEPALDEAGETVKADADREITLPSFNVMLQYALDDRFKVFVNLDGEEAEDVSVANLWGEYQHNQYLNVRLGKTYRRFGLYNEMLDAVPTYIGIEAPELFDGDHLLISRTTLAMVHGWVPLGDGELRYSWSTDNGEGGPNDDNVPMGFDLRYDWGLGNYRVGISGYTSNGDTTSDVDLGEGSPNSGVLPWMAADDFYIIGAYGELNRDGWQLQAAYWHASHDAERDPASVVTVIQNAGVNAAQLDRFLIDPDGPVTEANVDVDGDYDVDTWYLRGGYSFMTRRGEVVPYVQWDYYENPETIESKTWGGDAEAGLADDGEFSKATVGVVYRPAPDIAMKLDASMHIQEFNGSTERYPEIRFDVSYIFGR